MNDFATLTKIAKALLVAVLAALASFAIEAVVFNWQTLETALLEEVQPLSSETYDSNGYHCIEYTFADADLQDISLTSDLPDSFDSNSSCSIFVIDEGSSVYSKLGDVFLGASSSYVLHPTGKVKKLLIAAGPVTPKASVVAGTAATYSLSETTQDVNANESSAPQSEASQGIGSFSTGSVCPPSAPLKTTSNIAGVRVKENGSTEQLDSLPIGLPYDYSESDLRKAYFASPDNILQPGEFYIDYSAQFNLPIPIDISKRRLALLFAGLLLLYTLRPKSGLYNRSYSSKPFLACLCLVYSVCAVAIVATHYGYINPDDMNYRQYIELAEALANGHLFIDAEPSAALMAMDNPYDTNARAAACIEYLWDYAYFNGHYYVYFGILPALLYQLPFYLLTGAELPVVVDIIVSAVAFICGVIFLLKKTCDRWFVGISQGFFFILVLVLLLGSWVSYACAVPGHYSVPIITGLACLVWGLGFWVSATEAGTIRAGQAVTGSVFVALVIACRPQLLAGGLIGLVLLAGCFQRMDKRVFAKRLAIALVPFIAIFALIGCYNAARFGSPFDFGANYNLTTNDMTHREFSLDRLPFALFSYLIQPPSVVLQYPYLTTADLSTDYYGINIVESMWGGIFSLTPVLFISVLLATKQFRKRFPRIPLAIATVSIAIGFLLAAFDANGAGVLMRYMMDLGFFFAFAAVLCIAQLWTNGGSEALVVNEIRSPQYSAVGMLLVVLVLLSYLFQAMWLLGNAA